jgi:isopenicillin-N epimerase
MATVTPQQLRQWMTAFLTRVAVPEEEAQQWFTQMFAARLPAHTDLEALKQRLYDDYRVEVPVVTWNGQKFIRVSLQGYNTPSDADTLVGALARLLETAPP